MINSIKILIILAFLGLSSQGWSKPQTGDFETARDAFVENSQCKGHKALSAGKDHGDMSSCVMGDGRTVVWEVEKAQRGKKVQRIRFTWFDFAVDDPTEQKRIAPHVDQDEAERMVDAFLDTYAPCKKDSLKADFFGRDERETRNLAGDRVAVQHFHNPSLVERVIEIRPEY